MTEQIDNEIVERVFNELKLPDKYIIQFKVFPYFVTFFTISVKMITEKKHIQVCTES